MGVKAGWAIINGGVDMTLDEAVAVTKAHPFLKGALSDAFGVLVKELHLARRERDLLMGDIMALGKRVGALERKE